MLLLTAGGTGGHLFPAEAIAQHLKANGYKVAIITDLRAAKFMDYDLFDKILINDLPSNPNWLKAISLIKATFKSLYFIRKHKITKVLSFGGFPCMPASVAALVLGKPLFIHEQNAIMGQANTYLSKFSNFIATSFRNTVNAPANSVVLGNPVRSNVVLANATAKQNNELLKILILGGSQGSALFSKIVPLAFKQLTPEVLNKIEIVQQCRLENLNEVESIYKDLKIKFLLKTFFKDAPDQIKQADLLITRAGATTISEATCLGTPCIFIPLANSKSQDQWFNAQRLVDAGAAWCLVESEFNADSLANLLTHIVNNPQTLKSKIMPMKQFGNINATFQISNWFVNNPKILKK